MTVQPERQAKVLSPWSVLFKSAENRKRIVLVVTAALLTIWNGQSVISYYFSPVLDDIGVIYTRNKQGLTAACKSGT